MRFLLTAEKSAGLSPAQLKKIAAALSKAISQPGTGAAHIVGVGVAKMKSLNHDWRGKNKPTNVLSYPQFEPAALKRALKKIRSPLYLGDIALCPPYIAKEAQALKKPLNRHLTHLVVHGVLHLLGYDHITARQANLMETTEKTILATLGLPDPYAEAAPKPRARR